MLRRGLVFAAVTMSILVIAHTDAHAGIVTLSDYSNSDVGAEYLDAEVSFSVVGTTLTIGIENLTPAGDLGFSISQLYFNADDATVTGLSLDSGPSNWSLSTAQQCDGYGIFDFALKVLEDHKNDEVFGGETGTFTFTVTGSGFSESDFYTEFSVPANGEPDLMILGAKFQRGPIGSGSGYGVTDIPEPATVCLLGLGMVALLRKRRA